MAEPEGETALSEILGELPTLDQVASTARRSVLPRLVRDPQAVVTATLLLVVFALGALSPLISPADPNGADLNMINAPFGTPGRLLGGDESGRDIVSRLLYSIRTSGISALIGASVALAIGVTAGLVGGYFGTVERVLDGRPESSGVVATGLDDACVGR